MTQATHPQNPDVQLLDGDFYARGPHPTFDWMRAHAPVYWDAAGQVWGVTRHADVMRVSKDPETFCSRFGSRPDSPQIPSMI
ncbi:MAG: cytochrome P450, partial [Proteobacteria bacterium]|nr:cytochrome P450 [Pseudomonadota bacterium]